MSNSIADLRLKRGQLVERMAHQRADLSRDLAPVQSALATVDRARVAVHSGISYLKQHPLALIAGVAGLAVLRPRRMLYFAGQGLVLWRNWRNLRALVPEPLMRGLKNRLASRFGR